MGDLALEGNFICCLIIVAIDIGRAYIYIYIYLAGGDFEVIIWRSSHKRMGTVFTWEVDASKPHAKILF